MLKKSPVPDGVSVPIVFGVTTYQIGTTSLLQYDHLSPI